MMLFKSTISKIFGFIALFGWLMALFAIWYIYFSPPQWWIASGTIDVETPANFGISPEVTIDIRYRDNFFVHWNRLLYKSGSNDWNSVCEIEGSERVFENQDPVITTVAELFPNCAKTLAAGQYSVEFDLEIHDNNIVRDAFVESNIFEVKSAVLAAPHRVPQITPAAPSTVEPERAQRHYRYHGAPSSVPFFLRWLFPKGK